MSHSPVHYSIKVATPSALAAYAAAFDSGDEADVASLGYSFVFSATSTAVVDNVAVINGPGSVGRWLRGTAKASTTDASLALSTAQLTLLAAGDSITTGSNVAHGGSGIVLGNLLRARGLPVMMVGPVNRALASQPVPIDPMCAGYPGDTIEVLTARYQIGGAIYNWVQTFGAPDLHTIRIGTNNAYAGESAAAMKTKRDALWAAVLALMPNTETIIESIPSFYTPAAPTGGLVAANAVIAAYNADQATDAPAFNSLWSYIDSAAGLGRSGLASDGVHPSPGGQATIAVAEYNEIVRRHPLVRAPSMPRDFTIRAAQSFATLTNKAADQIIAAADDGWRLPAANFLIGCQMNPTDLTNVATTGILFASPAGLGYNHGWMVSYESAALTKYLNLYLMGAGPSLAITNPPFVAAANALYWLFAHGDYSKGIASLWLGTPTSATAPGARWTLACLGADPTAGQWSQGDVSPKLQVGKNANYNGFAGSVAQVFMATVGVPGFLDIRPRLEKIMFEGASPVEASGYLPCNEGAGAACASAIGGTAGVFAAATWTTAGTPAWPSGQ